MSKISVLLVRSTEHPRMVEIENTLESMQKIVGGYIEEVYPFDDNVVIVCDEEAKLKSKDLNRAIYTDDGEIADIIAGDFFVAYAPPDSDELMSLPNDLINEYKNEFYFPQMFVRSFEGKIKAIPIDGIDTQM